ncbi:hypothetical protein M9Y10_026579 [Tritrichomonas musculus]|uniref:DUF3447 domain-containing protein n=1 Tax=Tritrichomonas musculus TaxID=1915356 RepID=A0ABR2H5Z9_9EUKA
MNSQNYLDMMKNNQGNILQFLEEEEEANSDEQFQILKDIFNDTKIKDNIFEFLSLLHLISKIADNFHRSPAFICKIERILRFFKEDIKKYFSNSEIFNIFKKNKRILLFLIEEKIIFFDEYIVKKITTNKKFITANYPQYFQPEIQPFINEKWFPRHERKNSWFKTIKNELPADFYLKRKKGENDHPLCELIRNDFIDEFIMYITQNTISLNSVINPSIYETNQFLIKKQTEKDGISLIEYAAFFGSLQIFKHLRFGRVKLTESLWSLAIHGQNAELIHLLEDDHVDLKDKTYKYYFYESLKCHHNNIADYFLDNFMKGDEENLRSTFNQSLKFYNFAFLKNDFIDEDSLFNLCKYDYCTLVDSLLQNKDIDINKKIIYQQLVNVISYYNCFIQLKQ